MAGGRGLAYVLFFAALGVFAAAVASDAWFATRWTEKLLEAVTSRGE